MTAGAADDFAAIRKRIVEMRVGELCRARNLMPGNYLDKDILEAAGLSAEEIERWRAGAYTAELHCPALAALAAEGFHVERRR